jgi:hypothetical protein
MRKFVLVTFVVEKNIVPGTSQGSLNVTAKHNQPYVT